MINFSAKARSRKRTIPHPKVKIPIGKTERWITDRWVTIDSLVQESPTDPYVKIESTMDELHPGPPYRVGGPFANFRVEFSPVQATALRIFDTVTPVFISGLGSWRWRLVGGLCNPQFTSFDFSAAQYASPGFLFSNAGVVPSLEPFYSMVDKKLRPTLSQAGLSQAIAESREIPRMLQQTSRFFRDSWRSFGGNKTTPMMSPKRHSEDWLNLNFGWVPFVKDVVDLSRTTAFLGDYLRDLTKRNNTWQKVNRVLTETETDVLLGSGNGMRCSPTFLASSSFCNIGPGGDFSRWSVRRLENTKVWASGEYKFYRPEFDSSALSYGSKTAALNRLMTVYGLRVNPAVLWQVTPWSWLVDWYTNVGDVIQNVTDAALDGVVSRSLYLMHRKFKRLVLQQELFLKTGAYSVEFHRNISTKQRDHASTPFGFGLSPTSLSLRQLSILTALGISKFT